MELPQAYLSTYASKDKEKWLFQLLVNSLKRIYPRSSTHHKALFSCLQNSKTLQDSPSHRIFERMYEVLNVAKQNN